MKHFTLLPILAVLTFANACSSSKSDPAPAIPVTYSVELRTSFADMKYRLNGTSYRFGSISHTEVDGGRTAAGTTQLESGAQAPSSGTFTKDLGTLSTGAKITVRAALLDEKDKSQMRPLASANGTFLYVDIYVNGNKKETVKLDSNTPFTSDGRTDVFAESTITL